MDSPHSHHTLLKRRNQQPAQSQVLQRDAAMLYALIHCCTPQGHAFAEGLQCRFSNQSLAYVVNATVHSPQSASCWSPAWSADTNSMVNFSATTASSDCLDGVDFAYYLEPTVMHVAPITGPRYGSFDLRVQLEESVASFADAVSAVSCSCPCLF